MHHGVQARQRRDREAVVLIDDDGVITVRNPVRFNEVASWRNETGR